jgi:hypothetical protein
VLSKEVLEEVLEEMLEEVLEEEVLQDRITMPSHASSHMRSTLLFDNRYS